MAEPTTRQISAMAAAFQVAVSSGVDREELEAALSQDPPEAARAARLQLTEMLAALSTIALMAMNSGYTRGALSAHERIFYLGWQAADSSLAVGGITAEDFDDAADRAPGQP